jgi:hypothetical protein
VLRRIMWFVAGLLALAVIAAAIVPRDDDTPPPPPTISAPERTTVKVDIAASPERPRMIAAHAGDHLLLTVEADSIDTVNISGLDLTSPVSATTPAQFDTLLDQPGRFEVRLQGANKVVGTIDVKAAA